MEYALTPLFRSSEERIPLTSEEHARIVHAKDAIITSIGIEEKFDLILENYVEYEDELLKLALRRQVSYWNLAYQASQDDKLFVARKLLNLLSAARLYVDQMPQDLGRLFSSDKETVTAIKASFVSSTMPPSDTD